jgi:C4-type Zn-finger protein
MNEQNIRKVTCPECENEFEHDFSSAQVGDIIECPVCGANLELTVLKDDEIVLEPITTYK